jgi:hypothetical protein
MPAGLNALHDQGVRAGIRGRAGLVRGGNLDQHTRATGVRAGNQFATQPEGERQPRHALFDRHLQALVLLEIEHEVHAERAVRRSHDRADLLSQARWIGPRSAQRPQAARPRHLGSELRRSAPAQRRLHDGHFAAQRAHRASVHSTRSRRRGVCSLPRSDRSPRPDADAQPAQRVQ